MNALQATEAALVEMTALWAAERAWADNLAAVLASTWEADDPHYYDKYVLEVERVLARYREARP
jgi:hypothetical protein